MARRVTIEPVSLSSATYIGANFRQSDIDEMRAVFGPTVPVQEMAVSIADRSAPWSYTAKLDSQPVMLFGVLVNPSIQHLGSAWGFGTDKTLRVIPTVTRFIKSELIPALLNAGLNRVEVRLLQKHVVEFDWLRFDLGAKVDAHLECVGAHLEDFYQLSWTRKS